MTFDLLILASLNACQVSCYGIYVYRLLVLIAKAVFRPMRGQTDKNTKPETRLIKAAFHDTGIDTDNDILARILARNQACRCWCREMRPIGT